ncbi:Rod binding protein [Rhizobium sp. RU20A]|uniref:rod-binding protein n=1 Tax=Rhizobium sp. RU20A TaxID=1907412 RepID=UPI000956BCA2|nr:rod-binding protein [Rhizobium sp. RU20A]SIQ55123.1 Rod binding protein [Rhizobium sp. RU20A]
MAINPPSDIVMDVMRAADPAGIEEAQAKLKANRAAFEANSLADSGSGFASAVTILNRDSVNAQRSVEAESQSDKVSPTYRKFEAMVLQNFIKSMMPSDDENVYGQGLAGDTWKSMMAEQIGDVVAKSGGIGIAASLMRKEGLSSPENNHGLVNASNDVSSVNLAASIVQEHQRKAVAGVLPGNTDTAA